MFTTEPDAKAIFCEALDKSTDRERTAYLDGACRGDAGLRGRVEALLLAHGDAGNFLEAPAGARTLTAAWPPTESPGTDIGPYKLLEPIGEGGMGVVYMAEQEHPVRRKVALKLIKPGMDSRQIVARFEAERQALAMMDHPNIAKVHDAGATDAGRPYFVMELVRGIPITHYCDREQLSVDERLELFVLVCRAVQHAHQKGIIHRDLKPSNIPVTSYDGVPIPKVIDFGVAKATGQSLTDGTLFTGFHQILGTPLYMSPEQADLSGVDTDTRSDIYSLGVLLYELLTGTTPFEQDRFGAAAFDEICRIIREDEPPKPSTRLSSLGATRKTTSANRKSDARRLDRAVHGELDWIVMKALEKDRRRRYETANDFAADVIRYLTDQPVEASPPSASYRFAKLARRNRVALTTVALVATALLIGASASVWQAVRAMKAEADADRRAGDTRLVLDYLVDDVFGAAAPEKSQGRAVTVNEMLATAEATIPTRFGRRPLVEAAAREALGRAYMALDRFEEGERQYRRVVALRTRMLGPDHPDTLSAELELVEALAPTYFAVGPRQVEAEPLARRVVEGRRRALGPTHPATLAAMKRLGFILRGVGQPAEACSVLERTYAAQCQVLGPLHHDTLGTLDTLGVVLQNQGDLANAEQLFRRVMADRMQLLGPAHPDLKGSHLHLGSVLYAQGRVEEAIPEFRESVEGHRRTYGPMLVQTSRPIQQLLRALWDVRDTTSIREFCERWIREILASPPEADPYLRSRRSLRISYLVLSLATLPEPVEFDADLAIHAAEEAVALQDDAHDGWTVLGIAYYRTGQLDKAMRTIQTSMARPQWKGGNDLDWLVLALIHARRCEMEQARAWYDKARNRTEPLNFNNYEIRPIREEAEALLGMQPSQEGVRSKTPAKSTSPPK